MLEQGRTHFDLYNFFSVLLPGLVLILGLLPFAPDDLQLDALGVIIALGILGFVIGRVLHSTAVTLELRYGRGHREEFRRELKYSNTVSEEMVDEFWEDVEKLIDYHKRDGPQHIDLHNLAVDPFDELYRISNPMNITDKQYDSVYLLVRSYIHMDGKGRSRTFQSVYAFNRSMVLVVATLSIVYMMVIFTVRYDLSIPVGYSPYLYSEILPEQDLEDTIFQILFSTVYIIGWGTIANFNSARKDFRNTLRNI